ncbi:MAG: Abi family protein [Ruminococcus sp.]|nr:Abi family protein [Ruminococcus sp.]MCM1478827.1 Abi family protein [Muribaculaceae bacterium]
MEVKKPIDIEAQIDKIAERGCDIGNRDFARKVLNKVSYYRLTAYFLPFKTENDTYIDGTSLETVYNIHEFDCELRRLCFSIIEKIEIMLRMQIFNYHAQKYGALGYLCGDNFNSFHNAEKFTERINRTIEKNKNKPFVKHHIEKYDGKFPIWVIAELFTFSELSRFYSDMKAADQKELAPTVCGSTHTKAKSWLFCLSNLRNYCAHSARLYYTAFMSKPVTPKEMDYTLQNRIFDYIILLKFFYPDKEKWQEDFLKPLKILLKKYRKHINLRHLGFPENWEEILNQPPKSL